MKLSVNLPMHKETLRTLGKQLEAKLAQRRERPPRGQSAKAVGLACVLHDGGVRYTLGLTRVYWLASRREVEADLALAWERRMLALRANALNADLTARLKLVYERAIGRLPIGTDRDGYVLRFWDAVYCCWTTLSGGSLCDMLQSWCVVTKDGTECTTLEDGDCYRIFPATGQTLWQGEEGKSLFATRETEKVR